MDGSRRSSGIHRSVTATLDCLTLFQLDGLTDAELTAACPAQ